MQLATKSSTESFEDRFVGLSSDELLAWANDEFGDSLAVSTSFGIQSAVTLYLATRIRPNIKVIWVDTGYLPEETYAYALKLTSLLKLNLNVYESEMSPRAMERQYGRLWESDRVEDLDLYDQIRKVQPMQQALDDLNVRGWVSGLRASQTKFRSQLTPVKTREFTVQNLSDSELDQSRRFLLYARAWLATASVVRARICDGWRCSFQSPSFVLGQQSS